MKKKLSFIILMLLVLINVALGSTNSYAASNTSLENMNPGDIIKFAGKDWIILDPSTGFITLASNYGISQWNMGLSNDYENSYIKTYLNETFLNSLGEENKDLIQEVKWNCGPVPDSEIYNSPDFLRFYEEMKKTDGKYKVGLLTCSEYKNYKDSSVLNPNDWATHWLLTPVLGVANNEVWSVGANGNLSNIDGRLADLPLYVRPALYLKSGLFVNKRDGSFCFHNKYMQCYSRGDKMPRQARNQSSTDYYHVMIRGINREFVFKNDKQKEKFIDLMKLEEKASLIRIGVWCIMDNHVHLLLKANLIDMSKAIKIICLQNKKNRPDCLRLFTKLVNYNNSLKTC